MEFPKLGGVAMLLLGLGLVEDASIRALEQVGFEIIGGFMRGSKLGIYGVKIQDLGGFG
ncbi:hypothetical protein LguiA_001993 [Lonicera macranthoides]